MRTGLVPAALTWALFVLVLVIYAGLARAADYTLTVCASLPLPGAANTLNPNAPPAKQRQERMHVCEQVKIPDPGHLLTPYEPITDPKHDRRAWA